MRRGAALGWVAAAAVVACCGFACRQLVGIRGTHGSADDGGGVGGLPYGGECGTCVATSCSDEATACGASPACEPFANCVARCQGDPACRAACNTVLPSNSPELASLSACLVNRCETQCGLTCGAIDYYSTSSSAAACQQCIAGDTDLCATATACGALTACHSFAQCSVACQGLLDCRQACVATLGAQQGADLVADVLQTATAECNSQCASGADWQCLGLVGTALPTAPSTTMTVQILGLDGGAVPGVDVALCSSVESCGPPTTTDATGATQVFVTLPVEEPGPTGYLQFSSPADAGAPSIAPYLFYWGFPLSRAAVAFTGPPVDGGVAALGYTEVGVISPSDLAGLLEYLQVQQDPARGFLNVGIKDCVGNLAPGIHFDSPQFDGTTRAFYESSGEGSLGLSTTATETLSPGGAVYTNVPAGPIDVTATLTETQQVVATGHAQIRPGTVTTLYMAPTPPAP